MNDDKDNFGRLINIDSIPTFEMGSYPSIKISDIKTRRFNMIDRIPEKLYRIYY